MAITKANVFYGPATLTGTGGTGFSSGALIPAVVSWGVEQKIYNRELEDGNEKNKQAGMILKVEVIFDSVATADIALIIACTAWTIVCASPNKTLTIAAGDYLKTFAEIVDNKTKITIIKTAPIGTAITGLYTWAAPA